MKGSVDGYPGKLLMLSNTEILDGLQTGEIVIHPFDPRNLGTNSYDVTLGEWFFREQPPQPRDLLFDIYDIYNEHDVGKVWGAPQRAVEYIEHGAPYSPDNPFIHSMDIGDRFILLSPGENILAHTNEFIGGASLVKELAFDPQFSDSTVTELTRYGRVAGEMHARSSIVRSLLSVCLCAGYGDPGYINRWTMEITNRSRFYHIPLVVGRRVAQIQFTHMQQAPTRGYTEGGKYQSENDLTKLMAAWKPEMMLPRLYLDREVTER